MEYEIVILGHKDFPHAKQISDANRNRITYEHLSTQTGNKDQLWRNCDRNIRDWFRKGMTIGEPTHYLFLEYDVYADGYNFDKLVEPAIARGNDYTACYIDGDHWCFNERSNLPPAYRQYATVSHPLCMLLLSKKFLTFISECEYDYIFNMDIFCELRLPTIAKMMDMRMGVFQANQIGRVSAIRGRRSVYGQICHPVKTRN